MALARTAVFARLANARTASKGQSARTASPGTRHIDISSSSSIKSSRVSCGIFSLLSPHESDNMAAYTPRRIRCLKRSSQTNKMPCFSTKAFVAGEMCAVDPDVSQTKLTSPDTYNINNNTLLSTSSATGPNRRIFESPPASTSAMHSPTVGVKVARASSSSCRIRRMNSSIVVLCWK